MTESTEFDNAFHDDDPELDLDPIERVSREIRQAASTTSRRSAAVLVSRYYRYQQDRMAFANQIRKLREAGEDVGVLIHFFDQSKTLEKQMATLLTAWNKKNPIGQWAESQRGIGPILSAALLAHIDIERAATAGAIWRFAGLDPTIKWGKGEKRPYNATLKVICWRIGDSFQKQWRKPDAYYGKLYRQRKLYEWRRDGRCTDPDSPDFGKVIREAEPIVKEAAKLALETRNIKDAELRRVYESGHLPDGRLNERAKRWPTKLFLAHLHHVMYVDRYGVEPPLPYPIAHLGHVHYLAPPDPDNILGQ